MGEQGTENLMTAAEARKHIPAKEWEFPPATLTAFVYDERPCLNLMRSLLRDSRRWPNLALWDKSKDALIDRSRSDVATKFLENGQGDVLIMVDHDIGWEPGSLEHLVRICLDLETVVAGVHPKRGFGLPLPIQWGDYGSYVIPDDRVVECRSVTTAFMAIHRKVLEKLAEDLPMTIHGYRKFFQSRTIQREDGVFEDFSEDYDFCDKARAAGFRVFADLRPELTHFGTHLFRVADSQWRPPSITSPGQPVEITVKDLTKPVTVKAGYELWIDQDDEFVSDSLVKFGEWEPETPEYILANVREGDVIVEVGAHLGAHTVAMARDSRVAKVVAIEPLPHLVGLLRKNIELNGLGEKVEVWPMAMVHSLDTRKGAWLLKDHKNPGASHLMDIGVEMGVEVPTVRLHEVSERIDILKLDCEGAEYMILEGEAARGALKDCRLIVTEYCDQQLRNVSGRTGMQYLDLLEELGFDTGLDEEGRKQLPKGMGYCNLVAVRRDSAECRVPSAE